MYIPSSSVFKRFTTLSTHHKAHVVFTSGRCPTKLPAAKIVLKKKCAKKILISVNWLFFQNNFIAANYIENEFYELNDYEIFIMAKHENEKFILFQLF